MPLCVTSTCPGNASCPSDIFVPRYLGSEPFLFFVEPPCFFVALQQAKAHRSAEPLDADCTHTHAHTHAETAATPCWHAHHRLPCHCVNASGSKLSTDPSTLAAAAHHRGSGSSSSMRVGHVVCVQGAGQAVMQMQSTHLELVVAAQKSCSWQHSARGCAASAAAGGG